MATTKPRITITLNERQHAVLRSISENSGQSMSAFLGELLEQALPVMERMAEAFRRIKDVQEDHQRRIIRDLDEAQEAIEPALRQVLGQFDLFMGQVERAAAGPGDTSGATGDAAADPHPVITGVRSPVPSKVKSPKTRTGSGSPTKRRTGVGP